MQLKNNASGYGVVSVGLHWLIAIAVFGLFAVGLWMEGLDYTDAWYKTAPHWHKSTGVIVIALVIFRFVWRMAQPRPEELPTHASWERWLARIVHYALYLLLFLMLPTGYLITTAKGQSLEVFNWFSLPATVVGIDNLEDIAGEIHELIAFSVMGIVVLHVCGALKHHIIDKDSTLRRMLP
ncbi:MAG: cytochrome b [Agarilytica sp.]